ncbi:MAG TPA: Tol-Pal system beta propeller repeat protein TolB [Sedimenticola thiotaurini]|uniref:Tol-Pal system protein TolB n=1 Tax=Sedimenticola thiotaurini TaxID=1543721 RepID=A0A831RJN9_9GAMM|nr:Tol-Pal system beta propeller repeat protein TolB [Sedimenticola thiotaurini]
MKRILSFLPLLGLLWLWSLQAMAALTIEITGGEEGALPIAVVPFQLQQGAAPAEDLAAIVAADLRRSGRFKPMPPGDMLARPGSGAEVEFRDWKALGMESLVVGSIRPNGPGGFLVRFELFDVFRGEQLAGYSIPTTSRTLRTTAHQIADIVYQKLTGQRGAFATRIAYVTATGSGKEQRISLKVADADGYNPQTIVKSREPLMSPAWSPDGRKLAYVLFKGGRPAIYIQEVFTGKRRKVASYKGINGAPAWSPDGRRLAMTLSKDGNPEIYVLNLNRNTLTRLTNHYAIDTEPAWSPDGRTIVFTSDRGGKPQIYRVPANGGRVKRVTFEGDYNARASFSPDGRSLALVTRVGRNYRIGVLDLESGALLVLSNGKLDESPSFAPNGSMIIYATKARGKGELAAVSVDGRVRQRLALQEGDVREPVWSPFTRSERR